MSFKLTFTDRIDTAVAAEGDLLTARMASAIRGPSNQVLVPEGSVVTGRIVKAQHLYGQQRTFVMALKLETVDIAGTSWPIRAASDSGVRRFASPGPLTSRVNLGPVDLSQDRDIGVFEFRENRRDFVIPTGYESTWITLAP